MRAAVMMMSILLAIVAGAGSGCTGSSPGGAASSEGSGAKTAKTTERAFASIVLRGIDPMRGGGMDVLIRADGRGAARELVAGETSSTHRERRFELEVGAAALDELDRAVVERKIADAKTTSEQAPGDLRIDLRVVLRDGTARDLAVVRAREENADVIALLDLVERIAREAIAGRAPAHEGVFAAEPVWVPEGF